MLVKNTAVILVIGIEVKTAIGLTIIVQIAANVGVKINKLKYV